MIDGLGFEEANQSGLSTNLVQTVSGIHTRMLATNVIGTTNLSGLNIQAQGSGLFGRITNADGAVFPIVTGSATSAVFGPRIQIGSTLTGAEGFGSAIFNTAFANTNYFFTAQVGSTGGFLSVDAGSWAVTISGPGGRLTSGVVFKGAPSSPYTWVAIGL